MKRLIVCCDGTWNSEDVRGRGTNVWLLYDLIAQRDSDGIEQRKFYVPGVGSDVSRNRAMRRLRRIGGGAFGWGLDANIIEAYCWLMQEYEEGDEFWFFGFSRGAYTARSLAGLIRNCGILQLRHRRMLKKAIQLYRARDPESIRAANSRDDLRTEPKSSHPDAPQSRSFRQNYSHEIPSFKFIGVWDTVGALGVPGIFGWLFRFYNKRYKFHDVELSGRVEHAYQAIGIDERRPAFAPALWKGKNLDDRNTVEQVWFAGVHADVGGGYPEVGLSSVSLRWMLSKAKGCGLAIDIDRALQDAVPDLRQPIHDSRWLVHKLPFVCRRRRIFPGNRQFVHHSVIEKAAVDAKYRPNPVISSLPQAVEVALDSFSDGADSRRGGETNSDP